jgi:cell division septal protein FtsQ
MVNPGRGRSPQFMRSVRNRPALRRRSNVAVFMQLSLISLGIAVGGVVGWLGNEYVQRNETFRLREVRVDDVPPDLQPAVQAVLSAAHGANLLTIDLDWMHRQVQRIPAVRSATVRRVLPDTVDVVVEARDAFARVETRAWTRAVSRDGVVLGEARAAAGLPVVRIEQHLQVGDDRRLPGPVAAAFDDAVQLLEWLPDADGALYRRLSHVRVETRGIVAVLNTPEWEILFGDSGELDAKLAGMVSILKRDVPPNGAVIDLRYDGMVVVGSKEDSEE